MLAGLFLMLLANLIDRHQPKTNVCRVANLGHPHLSLGCEIQAAKNTEHTLNTLRYADRLKEIGGGRTAAARAGAVGGARRQSSISS